MGEAGIKSKNATDYTNYTNSLWLKIESVRSAARRLGDRKTAKPRK